MTVKLITGDCRDVMPTLGVGLVDACIADPPYGDTSLTWDVECKGWVKALAPTLKPSASIWVFGSMRFMAPLSSTMRRHGFKYAQDIVWEKQNGTGAHNDRFRRVHEHIVQFYRGKWQNIYHDTQYSMDAMKKTVRRTKKPAHWGEIGADFYTSEDGGPRLVRSVLAIRNEHGRAIHPTQKPVELLLHLVRYSCPEGGTVLDPFAGAGSTGIACKASGRNAVLIEKDWGYSLGAQQRLDNDAPLLQEAVG